MENGQRLCLTMDSLKKSRNMEEKLWILEQCFLPPLLLSQGVRTVDWQPRKYFGYSIPSVATLEVLQRYIDTETEVVEIGSCLGLYAFVFGNPLFCKRWIATDHPDTYMEWIPEGNRQPFAPVHITSAPLGMFTSNGKRVLLTIWPEPDSTYFWDDYVTKFDGDTVIIIGTPGVTGSEEMWDRLSQAFPHHFTETTVCKINLGIIFNYETVYVWSKLSWLKAAILQ